MMRDEDDPPELTIRRRGDVVWRNPHLLRAAEMLTKLGLPKNIVGSYGHSSWFVHGK